MSKFKIGERVRILSGEGIPNYVGGWTKGMEEYVGKIAWVTDILPFTGSDAYELNGEAYWFDERCLESVDNMPTKSHTFSYREVRRIKEWLEHNRDENAIPLSIEIDWEANSDSAIGYTTYSDDSDLVELLLDALEWFTEFYEGE